MFLLLHKVVEIQLQLRFQYNILFKLQRSKSYVISCVARTTVR